MTLAEITKPLKERTSWECDLCASIHRAWPGSTCKHHPKTTVAYSLRSLPRLKEVRETNGFTPEELAEETGLCLTTIESLETCRRLARRSTIEKLTEVLKVSVDELMEEPWKP